MKVLREFVDVFAWNPEDMTSLSSELATHKLNIDPGVNPIRQKKRTFAPERSEVIDAEVQKLLASGIVHKVYYPTWLTNPLLVRKPDGSWKFYMDFTNLNKHYPKDCYPLPAIDIVVEAFTGFAVLMFLDAYKGYHQIPMAEENVEKNSFYNKYGHILLSKDALWIEECRSHLPEAHE